MNSRVVLNRDKLEGAVLIVADGVGEVMKAALERTHPPDEDPIGQGLVANGDWGVWVNNRKVAGTAAKPRAARKLTGVVGLAGWPFPARFNEIGTVHQPARPFFSPVMSEISGEVPEIVGNYSRPRIGGPNA